MSGPEDTGEAPDVLTSAPRPRKLKTYIRFHIEPHHVRNTHRRDLAAMLRIALDPLSPGRASLLVMDFASDVLNRGLDAAIERFVEATLPVIASHEDAP